jgi:hypothetical protein
MIIHPAIEEIQTAPKINFTLFTNLMKDAAPAFVKAGCSIEEAFSILEHALGKRDGSTRLGKRRDEAYALLRGMMERTTFAAEAPGLIAKGYSPVPRIIKDGHGRPAVKGWSDYSDRQPTEAEIAQWSRIEGADISLACGYGGLLAIDVDDDRPEILAAVRKALPHCDVARRGSKGFALLVRHADGPQPTRNILRADEARSDPLIEIMGVGRVIAIPPSIHHRTGKPYIWIDPATGQPRPAGWQLPALADLPIVTRSIP